MTPTTRIRIVSLAAAAGLALAAVACSDSSTSNSKTGTLVLKLTDAPFPTDSVKSVDIFVVRVDGRQADADSSAAATGAGDDSASMGGWKTLATPNQSINLLAYQGGVTFSLGSATLTAGSYAGFRLVIDPTKSSVTLSDSTVLNGNSTPGIMFPSGSRSGIKINLSQPLTVTADSTQTMLIDFNVANSFVLRGNTIKQNGLLFKPVIQATVTAGSH